MDSDVRDIGSEYALLARVPWEVDELLLALEMRGRRDRSLWVAFDKPGKRKKPGRAALIGAILLDLASRSQEDQDRIIRAGMDRLNALIEHREPNQATSPDTSKPVILDPPSRPRKRNG